MAQRKFNATHPGEVIKDELIARGISQKDFAKSIGVPYTMLNDILNERRSLSATMALLIEASLGISADILNGLQADFTMQCARHDADIKRRLSKVHPYHPSVSSLAIA